MAHTYPLGQILMVTSGCGLIQSLGGPIEEIRPGDVVWCPRGEKHWHGATPTTAMTHIAIVEQLDGKAVDWMKKVADQEVFFIYGHEQERHFYGRKAEVDHSASNCHLRFRRRPAAAWDTRRSALSKRSSPSRLISNAKSLAFTNRRVLVSLRDMVNRSTGSYPLLWNVE